MGPHEVVVDHEEGGERAGSVEILEPGPWAGVELVGAVEPFDELLVFAIGFAFGVEVLQADDGAFFEDACSSFFDGCSVVGNDGAVVGGQSVGDEFCRIAFRRIGLAVAAAPSPPNGWRRRRGRARQDCAWRRRLVKRLPWRPFC